jgi:hypothetical protein
MYWCWSDLPQERPNFTQILTILKDVSFTNLIATTKVLEPTKKGEQITAACLDTVIAERIKDITKRELCPSMSRLMSLMESRASWQGEHGMQLFYGTDQGVCGMMQFQATGTVKKVRRGRKQIIGEKDYPCGSHIHLELGTASTITMYCHGMCPQIIVACGRVSTRMPRLSFTDSFSDNMMLSPSSSWGHGHNSFFK